MNMTLAGSSLVQAEVSYGMDLLLVRWFKFFEPHSVDTPGESSGRVQRQIFEWIMVHS